MIRYTTEQAASIIALPIIIILLCWTVVIFHKNRKKWGPYDIPIVSVLVLSLLRNVTVLAYTLAIVFTSSDFDTDYCGIFTWIFNSIHTFQASSLTSIAVIGLFSAKLHRKNQSLRTFLTPTHIIYHLFCLTTLCACVGVAAILAQKDGGGTLFVDPYDLSPCSFLPFELDLKFNVFIIVLHTFLASISTVAFVIICYNYYRIKKDGFDYIKKSNSDLSELSNNFHGINANVNDNRHYYDTYTINRSDSGNNYCNSNKDAWINTNNFSNNSEVLSNNSTTVSSTNSRRPCLIKQQQQDDVEEEAEIKRTGLETMHPVLIVCYLFYHLPLIVLCICPKLIRPWSVEGIALWLGLVQDLLIPIGLGIVDSRFCGWVTDLYRCTGKHTEEKLPQVGLDGKFRPFGLSSQPQSLDLNHDRTKSLQVEHRFPITNGSLYTSIDGRLPVIHNYRRHKEFRMAGAATLRHQQEMQSSMVALHSSHLQRRDLEPASTQQNKYSSCGNCEEDQCPSHSDLHHLSPQYVHRKLSFLKNSQNNIYPDNGNNDKGVLANHQNCLFVGNRRLQNTQNSLQRNQIRIENNRQRHPVTQKRLSQSQESINRLYFPGGSDTKLGDNILYHRSEMNVSNATYNLNANLNKHMIRNSRNLLRLNKLRLSRSEDSLAGIQVESSIVNQKSHYRQESTQYSSDDEGSYFKDYDSMSSSNSITTEANGDFEFFQAKEAPRSQSNKSNNNSPPAQKPKHVSNTKITRSNSKRSLENFQAFIEESETSTNHVSRVMILHRSNSYTTLEERKRKKRGRNRPEVSEGLPFQINGEINVRHKKNKSVENLPNYPSSMVCIEDVRNTNNHISGLQQQLVGSSVPDFKKVFISDYI